MVFFKRTIWSLFWLVSASAALMLAAALFSSWQSTLAAQRVHHEFRVNMLAEYVTGLLRTQEIVLDVVGRELLKRDDVSDPVRTLPLLDSVLESNPIVAGIAVVGPDGQAITASERFDVEDLPNLLTQEHTRPGFLHALTSDKMVLGRSYYLTRIDRWVIPIRKALRSETGEVVAVLSAGVKLEGPDGIFRNRLNAQDEDVLVLLRDRDGYVQYMAREGVPPEIYTRIRRSEAQRDVVRGAIREYTGLSAEDIRNSTEALSYIQTGNGFDYAGATFFDPRYELWVISEAELGGVWQDFLKKLVLWVGLFLGTMMVLFYLFRRINSAEQMRREELFHQARHDALTNLVNRVGLIDQVQQRIGDGKQFSIILLDIDNFRGINDHFGQEHGDQVLVEVARCLQAIATSKYVVTRLGGDEFAVICDIHEATELEAFCRFLLKEMTRKMATGPLKLQLGASVGAAMFPKDGDTFNRIIRSAHLALYEAKRNRNDVCLYLTEFEAEYLRRIEIEQRLRAAIQNQDVYMVYQPQCRGDGTIVGMEALARWRDDKLGDVPPSEFISVAETSGLMKALGDYVLDRSMREFSEMCLETLGSLELSINVSVIQFMQPGFATMVINRLKHYGMSPECLTLEITETLFMSGYNRVMPVLNRLRAAGIRLSMDDFGTGYSSLSLLRKLPLDELKVDKSFVDGLLEDPQARKMVESIVAIARNHDMELLAEGVESKAQLEALVAMGCERFQGYYFSRPVSLPEILSRVG